MMGYPPSGWLMGGVFVILALLTGCQGFPFFDDKTPAPIPGERISIFTPLRPLTLTQFLREPIPEPQINDHWPLDFTLSTRDNDECRPHNGNLALPLNLSRIWKQSMSLGNSERRPMLGQPVIKDNVLYVLDGIYNIYAFSLFNGDLLWRTDLLSLGLTNQDNINSISSYNGGITLADGVIYAATGWQYIVAISANTGVLLWSAEIDGPARSAPIVIQDRVIVQTASGSLQAFLEVNGQPAWLESRPQEKIQLLDHSQMTQYNQGVVVPSPDGRIYFINPLDGKSVWNQIVLRNTQGNSVGEVTDFSADPLALTGQIIVGNNSGVLASLNPATGALMWRINIESPLTPWLASDILFVATNKSNIGAITRSTGETIWLQDLPRTQKDTIQLWHPPVLAGGRLIMVAQQGAVIEISPNDGSILDYRYDDTLYNIGPIVANETLILIDAFGTIKAYGKPNRNRTSQSHISNNNTSETSCFKDENDA